MGYPEKFDTSNLDKEQQSVLEEFFERRKRFDTYLTANKIDLHTCPGCGYPTLTVRGGFEICTVCNWEDDEQDDKEADEIWGGPNSNLSLTENRLNIGKQLKDLALSINGEINKDVPQVLNILSRHETVIRNIMSKIPGDATHDHPLFKEYDSEGQNLLRQLITT